VPAGLEAHIIMDNYGTHKTMLIRNWFANASSLPSPLHAHLRLVDQPGGTLVCRGSPTSAFDEAFSAVSKNWKRPPVSTSRRTTCSRKITNYGDRRLVISGYLLFKHFSATNRGTEPLGLECSAP
jgi:hypothetical protein